MSSVAKGLFVAVFASTKIYLLGRLSCIGNTGKTGGFMRTITKGLILA
jgi:hypothetical protein